jgi:bacteriocin biosynthesis cyclodehydratase domain-containing protein
MDALEPNCVLAFKASLRMERVGASAFVIGERERYVLPGSGAVEIASLIDGRRTVHDIVEAARGRVPELETLYTLQRLADRGVLVPSAPQVPEEDARFWEACGLAANLAFETLARTPVVVHTVGSVGSVEPLADALRLAGVRVEPDARCRIVVTNEHLHPDLAAFNDRALRDRLPWCIVNPTGSQPLVGPFFEPDRGPCWECLAFWMRNNRPVETLLRRGRSTNDDLWPPRGSVKASVGLAGGLAALAIARGLIALGERQDHTLRSHLLAIDLGSFQTSTHAVVRRPQCPKCGDWTRTAAIAEQPIGLRPLPKAYCDDGGHRCQMPRRTYERLLQHVSPITGAATFVEPIRGRDTELRAVYASGYMVCPSDDACPGHVFDKSCAGKGRTVDQARASALCEALERFCGVYQGDEARIRGTRRELGPAALRVDDLLDFSDSQYESRPRGRDGSLDARSWVPARADDSTVLDWVPCWSLTHQQRRFVPFTYCYSEAPSEAGVDYCRPCGNGVAAGSCIEEAILQGLLELVERDAVAIWWYNQIRRPAIALESFGDPYFEALKRDYGQLGWAIWVLDVTGDLCIPACVALAHQPREDRFAIGFGCHIEPRLAVQRALTEVNQLFDPEGDRRAPWDAGRLSSKDFLFPDTREKSVEAGDMPRYSGADLRADIEYCRSRVERADMEVVVVDKSRPDVDLAVVQVIVPGLRHFWPRFGPGRLYQVPCDMGWRAAPRTESELNPVHLFV